MDKCQNKSDASESSFWIIWMSNKQQILKILTIFFLIVKRNTLTDNNSKTCKYFWSSLALETGNDWGQNRSSSFLHPWTSIYSLNYLCMHSALPHIDGASENNSKESLANPRHFN